MEEVDGMFAGGKKYPEPQVAMVVLDPNTGEIKASSAAATTASASSIALAGASPAHLQTFVTPPLSIPPSKAAPAITPVQ